ncbi:MAG: chorismate synthase [Bacteroidetes bacterium]|nr:chorismate synthase [Bacteroidota bacterium]
MAGNTFGHIFKLSTFGESHGEAIGGMIDGCPAGLKIDLTFIQNELNRRRPGQSKITTQRKEEDSIRFLSGIFEGKSTGAPIGFIIENNNPKSSDYQYIKEAYRPSHADYTYEKKYGLRDYRGGGRASARETACRVVGGAIAKLLLQQHQIKIHAYTDQVHHIKLEQPFSNTNFAEIEKNAIRCPDKKTAEKMIALIEKVRKSGDTVGGVIACVIQQVPIGLGEPVFDKLHAQLGKAMLSINAAKGFEYGTGFDSAYFTGSELNDTFIKQKGKIKTKHNNSGGIQGGISNGEDIYFKVAFKPVATLMKEQQTVNHKGETVILKPQGRHDPCVLPRAVPIVEAMAALVLADFLLLSRTTSVK